MIAVHFIVSLGKHLQGLYKMNYLIAFVLLNFVIIETVTAQDIRRDENVREKKCTIISFLSHFFANEINRLSIRHNQMTIEMKI